MNLSAQRTIGEIAADSTAAVRVFEKHAIDYCCGGNRPLAEVCQERGIAPETLLAELESASASRAVSDRDWNDASLAELIGHIVATHHAYLRAELPVLSARLAKVVEVHGQKYPESLRPLAEAFEGLHEELDLHLRKEEMILFPYFQELEAASNAGRPPVPAPFGTVRNPIAMMVYEHDSAGQALAEMRRVTQDYTLPAESCSTYRALFGGLQVLEADLHMHIHLENNVLFPKAARLE